MCTKNPFLQIFTPEESGNRGKTRENQDKKDKKEKRNKRKDGDGQGAKASRASHHEVVAGGHVKFRTEEEIRQLVARWDEFVHPRVRDAFGQPSGLQKVLSQLAARIQKTDDPILGDPNNCVYWYGHVTPDEQEAVIFMLKPGEEAESVTHVNRLLAFIFASDESFAHLKTLPKVPFKMRCRDQLCVHLSHISLSPDDLLPS